MRLTYVIPYFAPAWGYGGPPRLAYDMARWLVDRGHSVEVLTTDAFDRSSRLPPGDHNLDGIHVRRSRNLSNRLAWHGKIFLPTGFGTSLRQSAGSDVVHLFDFRSYQNAAAVSWLHRIGTPYVLSALGEIPRATGPKRPVKFIYDVLFGYRLIGRAAALLAQTTDEMHWYRRFGAREDQIRLVPLAIDLAEIPAALERGGYRKTLGIPTGAPMVLFVGRIHAYKGLDVLIKAFAAVQRTLPEARLVIAGRDDGYLRAAQRLAAHELPTGVVLFPGPVWGSDRFVAYRDADLFAITPSHPEQTSLAALEACAVGTPALVTRQAPIPGLDEAGAGVTVEYDAGAVARALSALLAAPDNLTRMGHSAARLVKESFSWPRVGSDVEGIYARAMHST